MSDRAWEFYLDDMINFAEKVLTYTSGLDLGVTTASSQRYIDVIPAQAGIQKKDILIMNDQLFRHSRVGGTKAPALNALWAARRASVASNPGVFLV